MSGPRIGLVGASRRRQGLGPFVARDLAAAGAAVTCFVATSERTRDEAERVLAQSYAISARGYLELSEMLEAEPLDALAILSPAETHGPYLEAALEAGLHVLCEKPLLWGEPDLAGRAEELVAGFDQCGLLLWENCQWPYTLPAYAALYPGALARPPGSFEMTLQPSRLGLQGLVDACPHPLSLLQVLVPGDDPSLRAIRFSTRAPDAREMAVECRYRTSASSCDVLLALRHGERQPRDASYALDGRIARRVVSLEGYRLSLQGSGRSVPLADPLTQLLKDFTDALSRPDRERARARGRQISKRMELLGGFVAAFGADPAGVNRKSGQES